ncbi:hypothetical protein Q1695_014123 [Nippostrongylus brasiliensis]|nr:hypothetical protein Q1695_014123 [Nippostrongylus brasiliensis]
MRNLWRQAVLWVFLIPTVRAQAANVNNLLIPDLNLVGPGVAIRLTPSGTAYVASTVALALIPEIAIAKMPFEAKSATFASLPTVGINSMQLRFFQNPRAIDVSTVSPNMVFVRVHDSNISVTAIGSGRIDDIPLTGPLEIRASRFQLDARVQIMRNPRGNPTMKVDLCRVNPNVPVTVNVQNGLTTETGIKFANAVSRDGHTLFQDLICPRLIFLIEKRINQRFGLLNPRISLGDIQDFDLVKSILASQQEEMKRKVFRNYSSGMAMARSKRQANRSKRQTQRFHTFLNNFNLTRANSLILDYTMMNTPIMSARGIEFATSGEITSVGQKTPFGPRPLALPLTVSANMLQMVVSDFVPNTLMFHGHKIGLFNARIDSNTPQLGPVMHTTCDMSSGSLFCVGDLFPTLRDLFPNRAVAFTFSTYKAPAIVVRPPELGGIRFQMVGLIDVAMFTGNAESSIGTMEIYVNASMKMRLSSKAVRGKVNLDSIKLVSRTPRTLVQEELDDAGFLSREILQRMVNDILKQGIPIPVHPLFKLLKPKLIVADRSLILETNFQLNQNLIRQLTSERLS